MWVVKEGFHDRDSALVEYVSTYYKFIKDSDNLYST